jgi:hypothetical protein
VSRCNCSTIVDTTYVTDTTATHRITETTQIFILPSAILLSSEAQLPITFLITRLLPQSSGNFWSVYVFASYGGSPASLPKPKPKHKSIRSDAFYAQNSQKSQIRNRFE